MQRKRKRDKEAKKAMQKEAVTENKAVPLTRLQSQEQELKRSYWRRKKQESRKKRGSQKARREKEKNTAQHQRTRHQQKSSTKENRKPEQPMSPLAVRLAAHRASTQGKMPKRAQAYAKVIKHLIVKASPTKKEAIRSEGIRWEARDVRARKVLEKIEERMALLKNDRTDDSSFEKKYLRWLSDDGGNGKEARLKIKTPAGFLNKRSRQRNRKPKFSNIITKRIHEVFNDNSVTVPDKKLVSKKTKKPTQILSKSVEQIYKEFKKKYPNINIGRSTFCYKRPKHIRVMKFNKRSSCLCEYCENITLKLKACRKFNDFPFKNKFELNRSTLCPSQGQFSAMKCISRKCESCGVNKVSEELADFTEKHGAESIKYDVWERIKYKHNDTVKTKIAQVTKTCYVREMLVDLLGDLKTYAKHIFDWEWQAQQFKDLKNRVPDGILLSVMDFQQNYSCESQDEIQSAHWAQEQITLHPTVCWYRCNEHKEIVKESVIHVSSDLTHDHHAVHHFQKAVAEHIRSRQIEVDKHIQFTDGCGCQYKSKGPFMDISMAENELGYPIERNYFGSRHGKGPSDGEGGVVKSRVDTLVKARTLVNGVQAKVRTAEEFFELCKLTLTKDEACDQTHREKNSVHTRRVFKFVPRNAIARNRQAPEKGVKGTRDFYSVRSTKKPGRIQVRTATCECHKCTDGFADQGVECEDCVNAEYVGRWEFKELQLDYVDSEPETERCLADPPVMHDMVTQQSDGDRTSQTVMAIVHTAVNQRLSDETPATVSVTKHQEAGQSCDPTLHPVQTIKHNSETEQQRDEQCQEGRDCEPNCKEIQGRTVMTEQLRVESSDEVLQTPTDVEMLQAGLLLCFRWEPITCSVQGRKAGISLQKIMSSARMT